MWGHNQQSAGTSSGTATSRHGLLGIGTARHKSSPGRIAEEGASGDQLDNLSEQQLVASEDGSDKSPSSSGEVVDEEVVLAVGEGDAVGKVEVVQQGLAHLRLGVVPEWEDMQVVQLSSTIE